MKRAQRNIELLVDKIASLNLKNNNFKTKIGKITLKNCSLLDDRIVFANKGIEFLVIPRQRFIYQHYSVIDKIAKPLGIEAIFSNIFEGSDIYKNITLIYKDKYTLLESIYDASPEYSITNGYIPQANLYDFVAYVLLNNKDVKFSK
jgi:hypothetical protein